MNNAIMSALPRFDEGGDLIAQRKRIEDFANECVSTPEPPVDVEDSILPEAEPRNASETPECIEEAIDPLANERQALSAATALFSQALSHLEEERNQHICQQVNEIASVLFPKLAYFFLSEEIKAHLPGLIPFDAPSVTVCTPKRLYHQLHDWAASSGELPASCKLEPMDSLEQGQIKISWQHGGYDYDFNALLAACLGRSDVPSRINEDLDNECT